MVRKPEIGVEKRVIAEIFLIARVLAAEIRREGASVQLTVPQFTTLRFLDKGDMSVGELAKNLYVAMPTVTQSTDSLVSKGLVERYEHERDRRQVRLRITPGGRQLLDESHQVVEDILSRALVPWSQGQKERLASTLEEARQLILSDSAQRQG